MQLKKYTLNETADGTSQYNESKVLSTSSAYFDTNRTAKHRLETLLLTPLEQKLVDYLISLINI